MPEVAYVAAVLNEHYDRIEREAQTRKEQDR
jgi:hypothetical protein